MKKMLCVCLVVILLMSLVLFSCSSRQPEKKKETTPAPTAAGPSRGAPRRPVATPAPGT
ncbi:MAG: hypothetical protein NT106_07220 [Candidatus Sumerlaeota bacterium]|nr:hypothetical protein [Candidatus Sumerlaeota bacterium]